MKGTILKRNDLYYAVYSMQLSDGTKMKKMSMGFKYKDDCREFLKNEFMNIKIQNDKNSSALTLGDYLTDWIEYYAERKNLAENTRRGYRVNINNHIIPEIGDVQLENLTPEHIDKLLSALASKGLSGTSQLYVYATLRRALNSAQKRRLIKFNVVNLVEAPKKNNYEACFLTKKQMNKLKAELDRLEINYSIPFYILLYLGLRRGEMLGLKWSDINFDENVVHIQRTATPQKGGYKLSPCKTAESRRFLLLPDVLRDKLIHWQNTQKDYGVDSEFVLMQEKSKILSATTLNKHYYEILESAGLPKIRIHDLRHSWASLLAVSNVPVKITSQMLGHSDIQTTLNIYTHSNIEMQKTAINTINNILT